MQPHLLCPARHSHIHSLRNSFIFIKSRNVQIWKNGQQFATLKGSKIIWVFFDVMPSKPSLVAVGSRDALEMYPKCAEGWFNYDEPMHSDIHP